MTVNRTLMEGTMGIVVAIDGPSGSGKSTVSRRVAAELGLAYLDTGAMYRAAAWWCEHEGIDLGDGAAVAEAVAAMPLHMGLDPEHPTFMVDGTDVSTAIREPHIATVVSKVATNLEVRAELARRQREIIRFEATGYTGSFSAGAGIVAEGRDITTVIAPDADARLLVTASEEARLARRAGDLEAAGKQVDADALRDQVVRRDRDDATVSQFLTAPEGVILVDTSELTLEQSVERVLDLVEEAADAAAQRDAEEDLRAQAMRAGLADYELDEEDLALLEADGGLPTGDSIEPGLPVLAVVGRPNVGKSTLVNRVLGRREAVVQDTPGVTRDRVSYPAEWAGRRFTIVDTGGWEVDVAGLDAAVATQAEIAVEMADAVLLVVDAQVGITETDARVVRMLRRSGKPVVLAANKVDSPAQEGDAATLWNLGLGEPFPVSALHGRGSGEVLDAVMEVLPEVSAVATAAPEGDLHRIALVGRPNVGKSSLLNSIAGQERVVVNETAGTTRDPVDEIIELDGRQWVFVDTAGIRRRVKQSRGADYYAVLRTQGAIDKAEVAVVLLDASEPISEQDVRVVQQAVDAGRALVLVNNKWDLVDEERQKMLLWEVEHDLAHVSWAPTSTWQPGPAGTPTGSCALSTPHWRVGPRACPQAGSTASWGSCSPPPRTRCEAVSSPASSSPLRSRWPRPGSSSSPPVSSTPATGASSSGACVRSSASPAPPSRSGCACVRSASGAEPCLGVKVTVGSRRVAPDSGVRLQHP